MTDYFDLDIEDFNPFSEEEISTDFMPDIDQIKLEIKGLKDETKKRATWHKAKNYREPLCDLNDSLALHRRKWGMYASAFKSGNKGIPLSEIKRPENVKLFALKGVEIAKGMLRLNLTTGWCIITTPKRRHKENHFSTMVCQLMASMLAIPFYDDVLLATSRQRINARFELNREIKEPNIIIYDDIITTGSTLQASIRPFADRNVFVLVGISNH